MAINKLTLAFMFLSFFGIAIAQGTNNTLRGRVTVKGSSTAARNAVVTITRLKRFTTINDGGEYHFEQVPAGKFDVVAHLERVADAVRAVEIKSGENTIDFELELSGINEQVTVTARWRRQIARTGP